MIKALKSYKEERSIREFEKYLSFIEFHLIRFSLCIFFYIVDLIKSKFPTFKADAS